MSLKKCAAYAKVRLLFAAYKDYQAQDASHHLASTGHRTAYAARKALSRVPGAIADPDTVVPTPGSGCWHKASFSVAHNKPFSKTCNFPKRCAREGTSLESRNQNPNLSGSESEGRKAVLAAAPKSGRACACGCRQPRCLHRSSSSQI